MGHAATRTVETTTGAVLFSVSDVEEDSPLVPLVDVPLPILTFTNSAIEVTNFLPLSHVTSALVSRHLAPLPVDVDQVAHAHGCARCISTCCC